MKRPWMPLYVDDYQRDTNRLSTLEHGAYLLLLMEYWRHGELPDDERALARIARLQDREWKKVRVELVRLFLPHWKHKRVEQEIAEAEEISQRRKAAADERWSKERANADANEHAVMDANASTEQDANASTRALSRDTDHNSHSSLRSESLKAREAFGEFWSAYPRRDGANPKAPAEKKFIAAVKSGVDINQIIDGARAYARSVASTDPRFVAQAVTWLNQARWLDDHEAPRPPNGTGPPAAKRNLAIAHFEERAATYDESADEPYIPNASRA